MIDEFKIGFFKIAGKKYLGDIKIIERKVRYWQDRYKQLLREEDIADILEKRPEIMVVGSGCNGLLVIPEEVERLIKRTGISLLVQKTPDACKTFNALVGEGRNVAAIFHATG